MVIQSDMKCIVVIQIDVNTIMVIQIGINNTIMVFQTIVVIQIGVVFFSSATDIPSRKNPLHVEYTDSMKVSQ